MSKTNEVVSETAKLSPIEDPSVLAMICHQKNPRAPMMIMFRNGEQRDLTKLEGYGTRAGNIIYREPRAYAGNGSFQTVRS